LRAMPAEIWRRSARVVAANRLFTGVLLVAAALRLDAELGYRWQSWFNDSFSYLRAAVTLTPGTTRPSGYPVFLWLLSPAHSYLLVTAAQHLMGLAVAVMIYALARHRFGAPAWLSVLVTLPVLYDGFEIQLEHLIMADTLFLFLVTAAVTVVLWQPEPGWRAWAVAGLLLGASATVRPTGEPLLAVFVVYVVIRLFNSWRRLLACLAACVVAFAVPVAGYEAWYASAHGRFALTDSTGVFLYSRVMTFADCGRITLPADLLPLCTTVPPDQRPIAQAYIWTDASPLLRLPSAEFSPATNHLAESFALRAIAAQPLDYADAVWDDTVRSFEWNRSVFPNPQTYDAYLFGSAPLAIPASPVGGYSSAAAYYTRGNPATTVAGPFAAVIRDYQRYVWLPGTVYGLILLAALAGIAVRWRRGGREAVLPWLCSVALIVAPAATAEFDYRYVTTAVPFACLALAVALGPARLTGRGARGGADRGLADARHDQRDLTPDAP
jgi:hypothetical protein